MKHHVVGTESAPSKSGRAFTLVELLVVIAIIGLLVSLLIPAIQAARESARRSQCISNLRQMALGTLVYHDSLKTLPPGNIVLESLAESASCHPVPPAPPEEEQLIYCGSIGWPAFILPQVEQDALYHKVDFDKFAFLSDKTMYMDHECPSGAIENRQASENMPSIFSCPSSFRGANGIFGHKDYGANGHYGVAERKLKMKEALFHGNSGARLVDVARGTSNVFMYLEIAPVWTWSPGTEGAVIETKTGTNPFFWVNAETQGYVCFAGTLAGEMITNPINKKDNWAPTRVARSYHPGGINIAMCDGSAVFISEKMEFDNYRGLFELASKSLATLP